LKTTVFRNPSGRSNGLKFDAKGQLIACEGANTGGQRRITLTTPTGKIVPLESGWKGKACARRGGGKRSMEGERRSGPKNCLISAQKDSHQSDGLAKVLEGKSADLTDPSHLA
jgi:hypothetical protein